MLLSRGRRLRGDRRTVVALCLAAAAVWAASGVYLVAPGETALVTRFGAVVGRAGPGAGYHLPAPIEQVREVSSVAVQRLEEHGKDAAPLLTADDMLVDVGLDVQWRETDPTRDDVARTVKAAAEACVRQAVGHAALPDLAGAGLLRVQAVAAVDLQRRLDRQGDGVAVVALALHDLQPAGPAATTFRDVSAAHQEVRTELEQAEAYRERVAANARSEADRGVRAAGAYSEQAAREADGEAARFALLDAQYRRFPAVTRQRLYTEMMEHVLRASNKVVIQPGPGAAVTLPPELFKPHATPDTPALPPAVAPSDAGQGAGARPGGAP